MSKSSVSKNDDALNDNALWSYVSGKMSDKESHATELEHVDDDFWNDATEGLAMTKDAEHIKKMQLQLQKQIRQQTHSRKVKRKQSFLQPTTLAIFIVLILLIIGYFVLHTTIK